MSERLSLGFVPALMLVAAVFCISGGSPLASETTSGSHTERKVTSGPVMTLEDCVRTALVSNPGLEASRNGARAAMETEGVARSGYFPRLDFQTGYRRWESRAFLPNSIQALPFGPIDNVIGPTDQYSLSLQGSYTLFDSGLRKASTHRAEAMSAEASQSALQKGQDTVLGVYKSFCGLLAAEADLSVARKSLKRSEDHLRLAEARKEVGAVPLADVLRARVSLANARLALVGARSAVDVARGNLNTTMGRPAETPLRIREVGPALAPPGSFSMDDAMKKAVAGRPELRAAANREAAGRESVRAARSAYGPTVTAEAAYGRLDNAFFPMDKNWAVGVSVQIPVFTGFERRHTLARARAKLSQAENERLQAELGVRQEIWTAHADVVKAYDSAVAVEALNADARESLRMADERYKVGAGTITDLLDAETNLAEAEAAKVRTEYGYRVAKAELRRAMGELGKGRP